MTFSFPCSEPIMRMIPSLPVIALALMLVTNAPIGLAQDKSREPVPKVIEIDLTKFKSPSDEEKSQVEQWLLELDLVPMVADRVAFTATGTYFFGGKGKEKHIANLRQYAIGWCLDNREDRERLLVINQQLLNPNIVDQGKWRLMQSNTSELDRLRIKSLYHEANGSSVYEPGPKSHIQDSFERANAFFPTRAATCSPTSCWSGMAIDRSKPMVTIDKMQGIQKIGQHTIALFEYQPVDYYVYFVGLAFLDGSPVQYEGWRQFRREEDKNNQSPTPEQKQAEREYLRSTAKRVSRMQSKWKRLETYAVPIWIQGSTLDDFYDIELVADIQWFVNDQVNPEAFNAATLQGLGPFSVMRE